MRCLVCNSILSIALSAIFMLSPSVSAQVRRGGGSSENNSGTVRRSTESSESNSGAVRRSSGSTENNSGTVRRSSGSSESGSGSSDNNSGTVRRSSGSTNSSSSTVRRSYSESGNSASGARGSSESGNNNVVRRAGGSSEASYDNSEAVRRSTGSYGRNVENISELRGRAGRDDENNVVRRSAATSNGEGQAIRNNNNVTRRGLGTVTESMTKQSYSENYSSLSYEERDYSGAIANQARRMNRRSDDFYIDDERNVMRIHPRERDVIVYDRLGHFYGGDPHYFGYRVEVLPPHYRRIRYYGVDYYYYNDVYYRPYGGYYVVCRPPFGIQISVGIGNVSFSLVNFAFYADSYRSYNGFDAYSRYIDQQNMIIARNNALIASQNNYIAMNLSSARSSYALANQLGLVQSYAYANQEYYYQDGVFYIINNGRYQVIVPPAGALVEELPDDYDTIILGGAQYYRVDDTVYRVTLINGRPLLEVLGQMYGSLARNYSYFYN